MTFKEAIFKVLLESGVPLHFKGITQRALARGWLMIEGRTPHTTVNAQLAVDHKTKGPRLKFKRALVDANVELMKRMR